jgi:prepilin-type N-terminal cleavage/methylation domain-containing protein
MLISRRETGFTLIEIMVVLTIIAIMTALIAPQIMGKRGRGARDGRQAGHPHA